MFLLAKLFANNNIFGWFLSIRGPDAEDTVAKLLAVTNDHSFSRDGMRFYLFPFSHVLEHRMGVNLLAPKHERLHFENAGLGKRSSTRSSEPPLTLEQRKRWRDAFETLTRILPLCASFLHVFLGLQLTEQTMN